MTRFDIYELEQYLGEFVEDYDLGAIIEDATEIDYASGNRIWKEDIDLAEICGRHDLTA